MTDPKLTREDVEAWRSRADQHDHHPQGISDNDVDELIDDAVPRLCSALLAAWDREDACRRAISTVVMYKNYEGGDSPDRGHSVRAVLQIRRALDAAGGTDR